MTDCAVPALTVRNLSCGYDDNPVVSRVSFEVPASSTTVLVGPNGVGKTTLFKTILGFLPALEGDMLFRGESAKGWTRRRFAQMVAYVPQHHHPTFGFTVRDLVLMGRTALLDSFEQPGRADEAAAEEAMERLHIEHLANRDYTRLSGGERQMVLVARALAQSPRVLVMDEPCANLDMGNQVTLLNQVRALNADGLAVLLTSHDPNHAFALDCDVVCLTRDGRVACGRAADVLAQGYLSELYGVSVGVGELCSSDGLRARGCAPILAPRRVVEGKGGAL